MQPRLTGQAPLAQLLAGRLPHPQVVAKVYLLYWYKSTNTGTNALRESSCPPARKLLARTVQRITCFTSTSVQIRR